jgi:hypothetical protein
LQFLPLAAIPIVFSVQQFCEGWVWTALARGDARLATGAATAFLLFALVFWPIWIPLSTLFVERSGKTRLFLRAMTVVGGVVGIAQMLPLFENPACLVIGIDHHSLRYDIAASPMFAAVPSIVWQVAYMAVVSTPLVVSSERKLVHAGLAVVLSAAISRVFFDYAFASVWCFFAAALSLYLCAVFFMLPRRSR